MARPATRPARRLHLDHFLPYNLSVLAAKVAARLAAEYQQAVGLQLPEARVLTVLGNFAPVSSNAVVQHTSMDKATVSRAIMRLIRLGLVTSTPDPRDRRLIVLGFTPRGKRAYRKLTRVARAWETWFVGGLKSADRTRLKRALIDLTHRVDGHSDRPADKRRSSRAL